MTQRLSTLDLSHYGFRQKDYYDYGFTDFDIKCWGLDQPGAPDPFSAGWVIWDALDGELDGEIDF
jgi:hypothetical protein